MHLLLTSNVVNKLQLQKNINEIWDRRYATELVSIYVLQQLCANDESSMH